MIRVLIVENRLFYARRPLFADGCFWVATLAEFDSRPGPVRDVLHEQRQQWTAVLARELRHAFDAGMIPSVHRILEQLVVQPDARW